jgi:hypothetical protein
VTVVDRVLDDSFELSRSATVQYQVKCTCLFGRDNLSTVGSLLEFLVSEMHLDLNILIDVVFYGKWSGTLALDENCTEIDLVGVDNY